MKFPLLRVAGAFLVLVAGCVDGGGGAGTNEPPPNSPASSRYGNATLQAQYSCIPTTTNFPDPHALAACRELLHRYPVQPDPLAGGTP